MQIAQLLLIIFSGLAFIASWININHLPPWNGFYSEAFATASMFLLLISYLLKGHQFKKNINGVLFFILFFFHAIFLYFTKKIFFISSSALYGYYGLFLLLTFQLGQFIQKEDKGKLIVYAICITSLISAFLAFADWLGIGNQGIFIWLIDSQKFSFKALGNIMQPNHLGTLCVMGIGSIIIIWNLNHWNWTSGITGIIPLAIIAALTASRATFLNTILLAVVSWIFFDTKNRKRAFFYALTSLATFTLTSFFAKYFYDALLLSDPSGISILDRSTNSAGRSALWAQAIEAIKLEPWTGFGWRQIPASQILVSHISPGIYATIYYHNFFLDLLVENGIVFSLCYLILFYTSIRKFKFSKNKSFLLIPIALIIPSLTEYQFTYTYLLLPAILCLSIAIEPREPPKTNHKLEGKINLSQYIILSVFGLASIFIFLDYIKCEKAFVSTRLKANGIVTSHKNIETPKAFILDDLALLSTIHLFDKQTYDQNDLEKLKYLSARFPYILIKNYFIRALVQFGDIEQARIIYRGVMNCYNENAKEYLNTIIDTNPSLETVRQ